MPVESTGSRSAGAQPGRTTKKSDKKWQPTVVKPFNLSSNKRVEERAKLASTRRQHEEDREKLEKELAAEQEKEEKRKAQEYRKSLEFKAQPIRHYKPVQVGPSQKSSTVTRSPKLATSSRVRDAREDTDVGRKPVGQRSTSAHARSTASTRPTSSGTGANKLAVSPRSGATATSPRSTSASRLQGRTTTATSRTTAATSHTRPKTATTTTKSPATTTKSPATTTKSPATTTKSPATTTKSPATKTRSPATTTSTARKSGTKKSPSSGAKKPKVEPEESSKPVHEPAPLLDLDAQVAPPADVSIVDLTTEDQSQGVEPLNERPVDVGDLPVPVEPFVGEYHSLEGEEAHKGDTESPAPVDVDVAQPFDQPRTPELDSVPIPAQEQQEQQPQEADRQVSYSPEQQPAEQEELVPDVAVYPPSPREAQWDKDSALAPEGSPLETGEEGELPEASLDQEAQAEAEEPSSPQAGDFPPEEDKEEPAPQSDILFENLSLEQAQPTEQGDQFGGDVSLEREGVPAQSADPFGEQGVFIHDDPHAHKEYSPFDVTPPANKTVGDFDPFGQHASFGQDEPAAQETNPFTGEAPFEQDEPMNQAANPLGDEPTFEAVATGDAFGMQGEFVQDDWATHKEQSPFDDLLPAAQREPSPFDESQVGQIMPSLYGDEPPVVQKEPSPIDDEPSVQKEPSPFDDEPAEAQKEPSPFDDEPAEAQGEPSPFDDEPAEAQKEPSPFDDEPAEAQKEPSPFDEPAEAQKEPSPFDDEPAEAQKEPSPFDDEPAEAQREPSPFDDEPAEAQREPSPFDDEPAEAQKEPSPFDDEPAEAQKEPSPFDDEPAEAQKEPSPFDDEPAEAQKESSPFDDEPAEAQREPSPFDDEPAEAQKEPSPFDDVLPVAQKEFSPFGNEPPAEPYEGVPPTNPFESSVPQSFQEGDLPVAISSNPFEVPELAHPKSPIELEGEDEGAEYAHQEASPKEQSTEPDYDQADADLGPSTSIDPVAEGGEDCERHSQEQEVQEVEGEVELEQLQDESCEPKDDPVLDRGDSAPLEPDAEARYSPYTDPPELERDGEQDDEEESSVLPPPANQGREQHHFAIQMGLRTITISPDLQDSFEEY